MAVCPVPSTLGGREDTRSGRFEETRNGLIDARIWKMPAAVTVAQLRAAGVVIGAQHYLAGTSPYSVMAIDSWNLEPEPELAGMATEFRYLNLNFAFAYPSEFNTNNERWRYNFRSEQRKITAVKTSGEVVHVPSTADVGLAIGIDGDTVNGVSVYRPAGGLTVEKIYNAKPSTTELNTIRDLQGKTNNGAWDIFRLGEVLFLGASFDRQNDGKWLGVFEFNIAPDTATETLEFSDGVTRAVPASPHDYVWVRYAKSNTGVPQRKIKDAHISTVYDSANFDQLGLIGSYT